MYTDIFVNLFVRWRHQLWASVRNWSCFDFWSDYLDLLTSKSCSLLASSTNLHSLQTGYWSPVTIIVLSAHRQGIISATKFIVARFVCILPHDVCQPKHKQNSNIAPTISTKIKESQTNICRFTCLTCRTGHYKTCQRLPSNVSKSRLC